MASASARGSAGAAPSSAASARPRRGDRGSARRAASRRRPSASRARRRARRASCSPSRRPSCRCGNARRSAARWLSWRRGRPARHRRPRTPASGTSCAGRTWPASSASRTPRRPRWSASTAPTSTSTRTSPATCGRRRWPAAACSRSASATAPWPSCWPAQAPTTTGSTSPSGPVAMARARLERIPGRGRSGAAGLGARAALLGRLLRPRHLHRLPAPHGRPAARVAEVRRVLRPGGELLLMVYNRHSARRVLLWPAARRAPPAGGRRADAPRSGCGYANDGHRGRRRGAAHRLRDRWPSCAACCHGMRDVRIDRRSIDRVPLGPAGDLAGAADAAGPRPPGRARPVRRRAPLTGSARGELARERHLVRVALDARVDQVQMLAHPVDRHGQAVLERHPGLEAELSRAFSVLPNRWPERSQSRAGRSSTGARCRSAR